MSKRFDYANPETQLKDFRIGITDEGTILTLGDCVNLLNEFHEEKEVRDKHSNHLQCMIRFIYFTLKDNGSISLDDFVKIRDYCYDQFMKIDDDNEECEEK